MKFQRYLYVVLIFILCMISISAVSAVDDTANNIISANENNEISLDEINSEDISSANDEINLEEMDESVLENTEEETPLKDDSSAGTFTDLNKLINEDYADNTTIYLNKNYTYDSATASDENYMAGIFINRDLTIEGNGITIDGSHKARIFYTDFFNHVTIKNINFINGNATVTQSSSVTSGGAIYSDSWNLVLAEGCNFTNNTSQRNGGAVFNVNANNCNFTENNAQSKGGAIYGGDANNCTFTQNQATWGGAMYSGTANNCTFTQNTASQGGATFNGNANNCTFTQNTATKGGAIYAGNANNCNFTQNQANYGGAMYGYSGDATRYKAVFCIFKDNSPNEYEYIQVIPEIIVYDLTTKFNSGDKLLFNLTDGENQYDGYQANIIITQNGNTIGTYTGATGENGGWTINLQPGTYNATLSLEQYTVEPKTITITVKDASFWYLNKTINDNDNETIDLYINYTYDETIDSAFKYGVEINRAVTIDGHGITIDGSHLARIFKIAGGVTATIRNINFINGNATGNTATRDSHGGAISANSLGNVVVEYCNFTNNTATNGAALGGALFFVNANNCTFTQNQATYGGAIYLGNANNCNFTQNQANNGGAITSGDAYNCTFTQNHANYNGGAIYYGNANNCTFTENHAEYGGAMLQGDAYNCTFTQNQAEYGGAMYGDENYPDEYTAMLCIFEGNTVDEYEYIFIVPAYIIASDLTTTNQSGEMLQFNLSCNDTIYDGFNTTITIYKNEEPIGTYHGVSGEGLPISLSPGTYKAVISLDRIEGGVDGEATITVLTTPTTITATDVTTTYNDNDYMTVTLVDNETNPLANVEITVEMNGQTIKNTTDSNGQITVPTNGIAAGTYDAIVKFEGNENYTASETTAKIIINKAESTVSAEDANATYGEIISIQVKSENATEISYQILDKNNKEVKSGTVSPNEKIEVSNLAAGEYTLKLSFAGDENYTASEATAKITVNKDSTKISASAVTTTYNVAKNLVITLKDSNGKALSGVEITVNLGSNKKYKTDKNGQVKVAIGKLVPKTYNAKISFAGNENYTASQTSAKVVVKKATPKMTASAKTFKFEDKTKKYTITLKDNKNKVMKNKKVTLKVNGKTYTAKTNSKGVATFKLSKLTKKGKYTAAITYAGDKYYNKLNKKAKITVKAPAWKTVAKGSKDKATVKKIQQALKNNGYYLTYKGHYLKIDGIYKGCTERSVKQFQKAKKLKVTGKVDYKTAQKLKLTS